MFTLICVFTRFCYIRGQQTKTALDTARCFLSIVWELGTFPRVVQSDRGREFVNEIMSEILELLGSKHFTTPTYTLRINGIVERSHQNMATTLRLLVFELIKYSPQRWGEIATMLAVPSPTSSRRAESGYASSIGAWVGRCSADPAFACALGHGTDGAFGGRLASGDD